MQKLMVFCAAPAIKSMDSRLSFPSYLKSIYDNTIKRCLTVKVVIGFYHYGAFVTDDV